MGYFRKDQRGMDGFKPDQEEEIAEIVQEDDRGTSVKDRGSSLNDPAQKNDPSVGSYDGSPDPMQGESFKGSNIKEELDNYQRRTKSDQWGND